MDCWFHNLGAWNKRVSLGLSPYFGSDLSNFSDVESWWIWIFKCTRVKKTSCSFTLALHVHDTWVSDIEVPTCIWQLPIFLSSLRISVRSVAVACSLMVFSNWLSWLLFFSLCKNSHYTVNGIVYMSSFKCLSNLDLKEFRVVAVTAWSDNEFQSWTTCWQNVYDGSLLSCVCCCFTATFVHKVG